MPSRRVLSKSSFLIARQCAKRLWLRSRGVDEPGSEDQHEDLLRDTAANAIERLAQDLFPELQRLEPVDPVAWLKASAAAVVARRPVAQARFAPDDLLAVVDILEPRAEGWFLWEVKASTIEVAKPKVRALHCWDLAFQWHVLTKAGLPLIGCGIVLVRKDYVRPEGPVEASALLHRLDVTDQVQALLARVDTELASARRVVHDEHEPTAWPAARCKAERGGKDGNRPSTCGHLQADGRCGALLPTDWVGYVPSLTPAQQRWMQAEPERRMAAIDLDDEELKWNPVQRAVVDATLRGRPWLDHQALRAALATIEWPVAYLDFEFDTQVAIPRWSGWRPYEPIPFQWAMCVQRAPGEPLGEVLSFLHEAETDPCGAFVAAMLEALPSAGSIVVHHQSAETTVVQRLAARLGGATARRLQGLAGRWRDTEQIAKRGYYHPAQRGSWSIKKLAPALVGRGYDDLVVADGMAAVKAWRLLMSATITPQERHKVRAYLLAYCGRDAALMHDILEALRRLSS